MSYQFYSGAIMMSFLVAGFFFLKFWKKSGERLFGIFAAAFMILAVERIVLCSVGSAQEPRPVIYLLRLSAFLLIIFAIIDKNRKSHV